MVGVKDQRDVESALCGRRRMLAVQQQQKIRGMGKRTVGLDQGKPFAESIVSGHDHGDLRSDANRLVDIDLSVILLFLRIVERQCRYRGAQHIHGQGVARRIAQQSDDGCIQLALFGQTIAQFAKFATRGQFSEPQQVACFFEVRMARQFVNIDAAIC